MSKRTPSPITGLTRGNELSALCAEPLTILIDIDGTLAIWLRSFDRLMLRLDPNVAILNTDDYNVFNRYNSDPRIIQAALDMEGFYADLEPMPGAIDAVAEMRADGHDVVFLSMPTATNPTCASDKYRWVERHFGTDMVARTTLAFDKTRVHGSVLLDDKPSVTGAVTPSWQHILFDAEYNRHVTDRARLTHWAEWRKVLVGVNA